VDCPPLSTKHREFIQRTQPSAPRLPEFVTRRTMARDSCISEKSVCGMGERIQMEDDAACKNLSALPTYRFDFQINKETPHKNLNNTTLHNTIVNLFEPFQLLTMPSMDPQLSLWYVLNSNDIKKNGESQCCAVDHCQANFVDGARESSHSKDSSMSSSNVKMNGKPISDHDLDLMIRATKEWLDTFEEVIDVDSKTKAATVNDIYLKPHETCALCETKLAKPGLLCEATCATAILRRVRVVQRMMRRKIFCVAMFLDCAKRLMTLLEVPGMSYPEEFVQQLRLEMMDDLFGL
jgi:hypothetical protein